MHNIEYNNYPISMNKSNIENECSEYERENGDGMYTRIEWMDSMPVFSNETEARKWIEENDNGDKDYWQVAVKYYDYPILVKSNAMLSTEKMIENAKKSLAELTKAKYIDTVGVDYIGCKSCGSKLNRAMMSKAWSRTDGNHCPVCNSDLRSPTLLGRIKRANDKIKNLGDRLYEQTVECEKKQRENAEVRWLLKIEYHS